MSVSNSSARRRSFDPTIYPVEERFGEKMGESMVQRWIAETLRPLLQWWLNDRCQRRAFVGADQFIYWRQYDPHARIAPDIYVLPGVDPTTPVRSWKLWTEHVVPSFVFEIVSDDWQKDYVDVPGRYGDLGVPELIIFDPHACARREGTRWQVYRCVGKRGLVRVEATNADRVRSKALGCWLRATGNGRTLRVRIAEGTKGDTLVPLPEEREQEERAAKEAERAAKEAERAAKEAERAAKEQALARVAELENQLRRRR